MTIIGMLKISTCLVGEMGSGRWVFMSAPSTILHIDEKSFYTFVCAISSAWDSFPWLI